MPERSTLEYPGAPGPADWNMLYRARGEEVQVHRSIFTGDIFAGVEVYSIGETKTLSVMVLQHPCALRTDGINFHPRLIVAEVREHQLLRQGQWNGNYRVMPLPELVPTAETPERNQAAFFTEIYLASPDALQAGTRVACLSQIGVDLLLQRWVHHNSRAVVETWRYYDVTGGPFEEADLIEEWCDDQVSHDVAVEQATEEAMKWLRSNSSTGVMRQKMLEDPQQRSTVRREMRAELRTRRNG
jgi:hypothetical protein